jgi:hypothetical protein
MPEESAGRSRVAVLSALGVVAVLVAAVVVVVGVRPGVRTVADPGTWVAAPMASLPPSPSDPPSPTASPTPSPTPKPSPSRKPKTPTKKATVKPVPSHSRIAGPPPAGPPASPGSSCVSHSGSVASKDQVAAALDAAAGETYRPPIGDLPPKAIQVSSVLLKAVAWQESGWQSDIESCYHAYGVMQVTADTQTWMHTIYGTSYDAHTLSGNTSLGAQYLAWLVYYFGHFCFGDDYDLTHLNPAAPDLRDAVLAAYNVGFANVDTAAGVYISPEARSYTNAVEGLMDTQPWNS